ncbi:MAG: hypothetical protein ACOYXC_06555 [Candidatus Rifleibacteriota bacterium]
MMQTIKEWLIYYVHDETFLGKALNAFVEKLRLFLRTIFDSSDGSLAGDAFVSCCLLLVHMAIPALLIFLYYGFRLRQIEKGIITDQAYQVNVRKYFGQASVVLVLNLILGLSYLGSDLFTGSKTCTQPSKVVIAKPEKKVTSHPKNEFKHIYMPEFNLLFSYLTRHNFPITCESKSNTSSIFFESEAKKSVVLKFNPIEPENFDNVPEETIYLEVFSKPLTAYETPKMLPHYDGRYNIDINLKIDEIISLTGFSKNDADKIRPVCKYHYLPELPPKEIFKSTKYLSSPKSDSNIKHGLTFEKVDLLVFNIPGGWVAYAVHLKRTDFTDSFEESDNLRSPDMDFDSPGLIQPGSNDSEIIGPDAPSDRMCIAPPTVGLDKIKPEHFPIITKMAFCTQKEYLDLESKKNGLLDSEAKDR